MRNTISLLLLSAGLAALGACSKETNIARTFYSEAGSEIETRDFGNATMNNTLVQQGEKSYVIDLTRRFAAEAPNTVVIICAGVLRMIELAWRLASGTSALAWIDG